MKNFTYLKCAFVNIYDVYVYFYWLLALLTHHAPELKIEYTSAIPRAKVDYIESPYILWRV